MEISSNKRLAQDELFNKTVISSVLRLQMNAIFYALILDKNKLSSIHKTHTHTRSKFLSKVLHILRLLVEVNAVVNSINKKKVQTNYKK